MQTGVQFPPAANRFGSSVYASANCLRTTRFGNIIALTSPRLLEPLPAALLLLGGLDRQRLGGLVVERLSALHGLRAVGNSVHELGYLRVLDGELLDECGERPTYFSAYFSEKYACIAASTTSVAVFSSDSEISAILSAVSCSMRYVRDTFATYFTCISERISPVFQNVFHHQGERRARISRISAI